MSTTGTTSKEIAALLTRAHREIDSGLLPSCQIAIARNGDLELFEAFGDATTERLASSCSPRPRRSWRPPRGPSSPMA